MQVEVEKLVVHGECEVDQHHKEQIPLKVLNGTNWETSFSNHDTL